MVQLLTTVERDVSTRLISEIRELKKRKNAVILAHNYQRKEIFEVADFIGDSFGLCLEANKRNADIIVFCGVHFMAESAAVLNPGKKVLLPAIDAGCAMSDMIDAESLKARKAELLQKYPDLKVVAYVNTTAEVKAESDICCTSSNAVKIVQSLPSSHILFVPDKNLAMYVQKYVSDKEIIAWDGYCPIHHRINAAYVRNAKKAHPHAKVIAHPECRPEVLELADYVCSTTGMLKAALADEDTDEFIVLTECGMMGKLELDAPGKKFYTVCNMCFDMKKTTLSLIKESLEKEQFEVVVEPEVAAKARKALDAMMAIS